jgi:hypothetical protein
MIFTDLIKKFTKYLFFYHNITANKHFSKKAVSLEREIHNAYISFQKVIKLK